MVRLYWLTAVCELKKKDLMDWNSILKGLGAFISAVMPMVNQRLAERKAGVSPESVPIPAAARPLRFNPASV